MNALLSALFAPFLAWWGTWVALAVRALAPARRRDDPRPKVLDVVIPAHDESARIGALVRSLSAQTGPSSVGEVVVVADHCNDDTAAVAKDAGATVIERTTGAPGKPPALAEGVAYLRARPERGDAVVMIDGDCVCAPGFVDGLARRLGPGDEVVQAAYVLDEPDDGAVRSSLRLGFALRNVIRASGADRFGLPVVLFGSGMLFRWDALDRLSFGDPRIDGTGDTRPVADDVLMALDLLVAGTHVRFAGDAVVTAPTPDAERDLGAQRLRWEGGQALMWRRMPRVAASVLRNRDWRGLLGLVEWSSPPLVASATAGAAATVIVAAAVGAGLASPVVLVLPAAAFACLATYLTIGVAMVDGIEGVVDVAARAPRFAAWKLKLYARHDDARRVESRP